VTQDLEILPKTSISAVVDMKRNQKYQCFNKYNISDWNLEA